MRGLLIYLFLLPTFAPNLASAQISQDDLFKLVEAKDFAAVEAALKTAGLEEAASTEEPIAQRDIFKLFAMTHPKISDFSAAWIKAAPDNPYAMTAQAWQYWGMGWALRGERVADHTSMEAQRAYHRDFLKSYSLFLKASQLAPEMLSASDGLLLVSPKLGHFETIPVELERVMRLRPNRRSLVQAMSGLGPQWGGSIEQEDLLCARYAPMISTIPSYDAATCHIDAVYKAGFWDGAVRDEAQAALQGNAASVLDYARTEDAIANRGRPRDQLAWLDSLLAVGDLTVEQALAYDRAFAKVSGQTDVVEAEYSLALPEALIAAEREADLDPLTLATVLTWERYVADNSRLNHVDYDEGAFAKRLRALLRGNPYSAEAWQKLGEIVQGLGSLEQLKAAQPYYDNAIYYSVSDDKILWDTISPRLDRAVSEEYGKLLSDQSGKPNALTDYELPVFCPLLRDISKSLMDCSAKDGSDGCGDEPANKPAIILPLAEMMKRRPQCLGANLSWKGSPVTAPVTVDLSEP
jgi:hypothetical protein